MTELIHYGTPRHSGRYPWGSGNNVLGGEESSNNPRNMSFLDSVNKLAKQGFSEKEIAEANNMTVNALRKAKALNKAELKASNIAMAQKLKDKAYSNVAIGERMGVNESVVRMWLSDGAKDQINIINSTSDMLKEQLLSKDFIDVGLGVEIGLGISSDKLNLAVSKLKEEGYVTHTIFVEQIGNPGNYTSMTVLGSPGTTKKDVLANRDKINQIDSFSEDGGRSFLGLHEPKILSSDRLKVVYGNEGGSALDGMIYVRPGVDDLSLGKSAYAQVRIAVDGTHYIKGMAIYKDDLPSGVDVVFNTNKSKGNTKLDALKPMKVDEETGLVDKDNPFGANIKLGGQKIKVMPDGSEKVTSVMNIVNEEGDWAKWSNNLPSQMLSKQPVTLAKEQLTKSLNKAVNEYKEISSLTNPTVKRILLNKFAEGMDSDAVTMHAASLPRTRGYHVLIASKSMKDNEVYAPNYKNGERVVLIRFPHAGRFEIPELTVNNKELSTKKLLKNARDAIGINANVAARLSGADFDGDSVLVIPNNSSKIKTQKALKALQDFDPKRAYPAYPGMKVMTKTNTQNEMGRISNLITDMSIKGAPLEEITRAVKHSMVVIDARNHSLNYKLSEHDNGIRALQKKYQVGGASTLISRATATMRIEEEKPRRAKEGGPVDKITGKKVFVKTGNTYVDKNGKIKPKLMEVKTLDKVSDARTLSSGTAMENIYASYSNSIKMLANVARKEALSTPRLKYSPEAKKIYSAEVSSLSYKLKLIQQNKPKERQAQLIANNMVAMKKQANPSMDKDTITKISIQAITEARRRVGAERHNIIITNNEWNAIQAGAISDTKLSDILTRADITEVRKLATPKSKRVMTTSKINKAQLLLDKGYSRSEVAAQLGVSVSLLDEYTDVKSVKGGEIR